MENMGVKKTNDFWRGKHVLVTGHTGFKGTWLCMMLKMLGAEVTGYALPPANCEWERFFSLLELDQEHSFLADVRELSDLQKAFSKVKPEIVFHLAAQPIVSIGYDDPVGTYSTNVMGTVNILDCMRNQKSVKSAVIVTTDKVYQNKEWPWGYRENDVLNGYDPYANSKSCAELVARCYKDCFMEQAGIALSTVRAGNVIGGGDFSVNRIIPDCIRAAFNKSDILVRNPKSIRPYQHVLEPLTAYMLIAQKQYEDISCAGSYNIGPDEDNCVTTGELAELFCSLWGDNICWKTVSSDVPHESQLLRLDCSLFKQRFNWQPVWDIRTAISKTIEFAKVWQTGSGECTCMEQQINKYWEECCYGRK